MALIHAKQCDAKSKRTQEKCRAVAVTGSSKCRMHGGKTPKGIASKSLKTGLYSKYLPGPLGVRAEEFNADPDLIEMRELIAVQSVRITELFQQLGESEPAEVWRELKLKYKRWKKSLKSKPFDEEASTELQRQFEQLLFEGSAREVKNEIVWRKIERSTLKRARLAESHAKCIKDSKDFITKEQFRLFTSVMMDIIKRNVEDQETLDRLSEEFLVVSRSQ